MTVSLIGSPCKISEEARLNKNRRIKESIKATKAKRKNQTCSTFDLKIVDNKLSCTQREALKRVFLEAKWLWNECIASGDPFSYKPRKNVLVKTNDGTMDEREYRMLGSQMKQSLIKTIRSNIKALATLKKHGYKVGAVGFTGEVSPLCFSNRRSLIAYVDKRREFRIFLAGFVCVASNNWKAGNKRRPFSPAKRTAGICMSHAIWIRRSIASGVKLRD